MKILFAAVMAAVMTVAVSDNASAQSNEALLKRLEVIEANNAKLVKENALLRGQVRSLQTKNRAASVEPKTHSGIVSRSANKSYAAAPPLEYSWTGFYVGVQTGYGLARLNPLDGAPSPSGWFGGGQLGYNYQLASNFVIGTEVDAAFTSLKDTTISVDQPLNVANTVATAGDIKFLGSVRARAGYAADRTFIYGTGGFAVAQGQFTSTLNGAPLAQVGTDKQTHDGWVAGAGIETALAGNWTAKLEYLYYRFGNETYMAPSPTIIGFDVQTLKVGLNYQLH